MLADLMAASLPYTFTAVLSLPGSRHKRIEDRFTILDARVPLARRAGRGALFAVADGVSSTDRASDAAETSCELLKSFFLSTRPPSEDLLLDVIESADIQVRVMNYGASTLAGLWLFRDQVRTFSLGDSAIYRLRGDVLSRLNPRPQGRGLTTFLGMGANVRTSVATYGQLTAIGDVYFLVTDGFFGSQTEADLVSAYTRKRCCLDMIITLEEALLASVPTDDVTLLAVELLSTQASQVDLQTITELL